MKIKKDVEIVEDFKFLESFSSTFLLDLTRLNCIQHYYDGKYPEIFYHPL